MTSIILKNMIRYRNAKSIKYKRFKTFEDYRADNSAAATSPAGFVIPIWKNIEFFDCIVCLLPYVR